MERYVDMREISDGRLYEAEDLVRADCGGCEGCSFCCEQMTDTILLDPLDVFSLCRGLALTPEALLQSALELGVVDGIVLPHFRKTGDRGCCPYLNAAGRCQVHAFRPGFCRLFPLGRYYEAETRSFHYFLQTGECRKAARAKVKVRRWIGVEDFARYERFIADWHFFLKDLQPVLACADAEKARRISLTILQLFYLMPYQTEADFYPQFDARLARAADLLV